MDYVHYYVHLHVLYCLEYVNHYLTKINRPTLDIFFFLYDMVYCHLRYRWKYGINCNDNGTWASACALFWAQSMSKYYSNMYRDII